MKKSALFFATNGIFFLALAAGLQAQSHEMGLRFGTANYRGELAPVYNFARPGIHFGAFYRLNRGSEWSFQFGASFSQIAADDQDRQDAFALQRDHRFETNLWEFSTQVEYNFLNFRNGTRNSPQNWTPYLFSGLGVFKFEPRLNSEANYETLGLAIPLGLGVKAILAPRWNIGLEFGGRFTFNDRLDDLGLDTRASTANLNPKFFSGNPNDNDMYFFTTVKLSYVIPDPGKDCPVQLPR
ncbi:MAG: hypothetical protein OHK0053_24640 [Microscillaceae bacterium]